VREPFLTAAPEYKTSKKLQQLLEKYLQRKQRQQQRQQQVSERVFLLLLVSSISVK
jgi:MinD-like ATPase involved in chromosome partitioning or flagellar assembly